MDIDELLDSMLSAADDDERQSFRDTLTGGWSEKDAAAESAAAKIEQQNAALAELEAALADMKAKNYDLLMQVGGDDGDDDEDGKPSDETDVLTIDDLFKERDE